MRYLALTAMAALLTSVAYAQMGTCTAGATEKKLAGAAKTSFMKKCESDASPLGKRSSQVPPRTASPPSACATRWGASRS